MLLPFIFSLVAASPNVLAQEPAYEKDRTVIVEFAWEQGLPTAFGLQYDTVMKGSQAISPHGFQRVFWQERALVPGPGQFTLDFNTDTLFLSYGLPDVVLSSSWLEFYARGALFSNNLLHDHAKNGVQLKERAFNAGYAMAGIFYSRYLPISRLRQPKKAKSIRSLQVFSRIETKQYFQSIRAKTSADFILPTDNISLEPSLGFTFQQGQKHGRFQRLRGLRVDGLLTGYYRPGQKAWGMPDENGKLDGRNTEQEWSGRVQLQVEGGWGKNFGKLLGVTASSKVFSGLGEGLDDRNRFLVGGENRYVLNLAGAGWGEFLADRVTSLHSDFGLIFFEQIIFEAGADLMVLNDLRRDGALNKMSPVLGTYIEAMTFISDDWLLRLRLAQAFGLPRAPLDEGLKIFFSIEWRILPW